MTVTTALAGHGGEFMWWQPESERERPTFDAIRRLGDYLLTPSRTIWAVYGVGSVVAAGKRTPLLVLDQSFAPGSPPKSWPERIRNVVRLSAFPEREAKRPAPLLVPLDKAGNDVQRLLRGWDVPSETRLMFSSPPEPMAGPGTHIWAGKKDGTIGFKLKIGSRIALSTAGHVLPVIKDAAGNVSRVPCAISIRHRGWFGCETTERIGTAVYANDPTAAAGVDIAIVELAKKCTTTNTKADLAQAPLVPEGITVAVQGGRSRRRTGWVFGAMLATRPPFDSRNWTNCWSVVEFDGGLVQPGDSGAPALLESTSNVLGHVVAAMGAVREDGRLQVGLIQDAETIVTFVENHYEKPVTLLKG